VGSRLFYGLTREEVEEKVLVILNMPGLEMADGNLVLQAIAWCAEQNVDFVDVYNAARLLDRDLQASYTLDLRRFSRLEMSR